MNKLSNRLNAIAQFVDKKDSVVDVGCDHGYLSIYLKEVVKVKKIIASDINQNALFGGRDILRWAFGNVFFQ